jgi:hypothetical protein
MPPLPLTGSERKQQAGVLPRLRIRNFYLEQDPSNGIDGLVRLQRPGLAPWVTVGTGPINAVFRQEGTFNGDWFVVSGAQFWRVNSAGVATLLGAVAGERAQIAASADKVMVVNGGFARVYDGTTFRAIIMPDGLPVQSVQLLNGYFVLTVRGTQRVFYMEPGESDPDALSFFEAERLPDAIVTAAVNGDELWLLGLQSEEVWVPSGDPDAPFERVGARAYENGCLNRDTLVQVENSLFWVTRDANVVLAQGVPQVISPPDVAEALRLAPADSMRAWFFKLDTHLFFVLTTANDTWAYDPGAGQWYRFASHERDTWRAHLGVELVAGDDVSNQLYRLVPGRSNDAGEPITREITGGIELTGAPVRCDSVSMRVAVGNTPSLVAAPRMELAWSDDEGRTWTDWRAVTLGLQGQYRAPVVWRKLGLMRRPGRLFWFRATDDVEVRISHASFNEAVN